MTIGQSSASTAPPRLEVFCSRGEEGYRVHVHPAWVPRHLLHCLDAHGEGIAYLDFDELSRHMDRGGHAYEKRLTATGSVELEAEGASAVALSVWLSNMFASGVR